VTLDSTVSARLVACRPCSKCMSLPKLIRNFFGFSRAETNGFLVLIPVILIILFSEPVYRKWIASRPIDQTHEKRYLDSLVSTWPKKIEKVNESVPTSLFSFNPNTASIEQLQRLGFSEQLAHRISNYRKKGGRFKERDDLLKIYGMDTLLYKSVEPYIVLPLAFEKKKNPVLENTSKPTVTTVYFDINLADAAQLKQIHGIGEKLSQRIINYRKSLGGFIRLEQLKEVFGLDSLVVNRLTEKSFIQKDFQPTQLNINTATEDDLDRHPYISRKEAKAIVAYRFQHGAFTVVEDVRKIHLIEKKTLEKILPYLTLD
jgi:competence protein ComEA